MTDTPDPRGERKRSRSEGKDILLSVIRFTRHFFDFVMHGDSRGEAYIKGLSEDSEALRRMGSFE